MAGLLSSKEYITYKIIHYCLIENIAYKFLENRKDLINELELITKKQHKSRFLGISQ